MKDQTDVKASQADNNPNATGATGLNMSGPAILSVAPVPSSPVIPSSTPLATLAQKLSAWKGGMMNTPMTQTASALTNDPNNPVGNSTGNPAGNLMGNPAGNPMGNPAENLTGNPSGDPTANPAAQNVPSGAISTGQLGANQSFPAVSPVPSVMPGTTPGYVSPLSPTPTASDSLARADSSLSSSEPAGIEKIKQDIPPVAAPMVIQGSAKGKAYPYTIEDLLQLVVNKNASDLHITTNYPAMLRIDGSLVPVGNEIISDDIVNDIVLPVLPESKQELLEVNREVDLAYSFKDQARFRINAFYAKGTVSAAFRLIPNKIRNIDELHLPPTYHQLTRLPQGLVLVTGPTGHGKSTTLAAIIQEINENYPKHIITIEDPIEYVYPKARALVAQREMHEDTHSWEIALRSAMREDPNVILVGEMRDYETIAAAITLAETGHLVFATLHTNSAAQTIDRIIDVFPEHQQPQVRMQLSVILEAIISQRLIPVNSGGRRAVSEVLFATGAVRNLIREGKTHQVDNVIRTSLDVGMKTLEHSLVELVREGELSTEDAESVALHPEELVRLLRV